MLAPGSTGKLSCVNLSSRLLLSVRLNGFAWSAALLIDFNSEDRQTLDLYPQGLGTKATDQGRGGGGGGGGGGQPVTQRIGASLSMTVSTDKYKTSQIRIFSRFAFIDRTGLDASVRTRRLLKKAENKSDFFSQYGSVERHTYAKIKPIETFSDEELRGIGVVKASTYDPRIVEDRRDYFPSLWDDGGWGDYRNRPDGVMLSNQSSSGPRQGSRLGQGSGQGTGQGQGRIQEGLAGACWTHGAHGVVLFHSDPQDNKFSVGLNKGLVWSDPMTLLALGSTKVPFEVTDSGTQCAYQLAHCTSQLPGVFKGTQLVTLMPSYCVVNCLDEFVELRQVGSNAPQSVSRDIDSFNSLLFPSDPVDLTPSRRKSRIEGTSSLGWHRVDATKGTSVQIRCDSSAWSIGTVNLHEVGTTLLLVPKKRSPMIQPSAKNVPVKSQLMDSRTRNIPQANSKYTTEKDPDVTVEDAIVLHVEVRFADPSDHSYVNIVVWAPIPDHYGHCHRASLSVRNETPYKISLKQHGTDAIAAAVKADPSRFTRALQSNHWQPFGWVDQNHGTTVTVTFHLPVGQNRDPGLRGSLDSTRRSHSLMSCDIDVSKIGNSASLNLNGSSAFVGELYSNEKVNLTVVAGAGGQILHITMKPQTLNSNNKITNRSPRQLNINRSVDKNEIDKKVLTETNNTEKLIPVVKNLTLIISLKCLCISLIAERPIRREFMTLYLDGIDCRIMQKSYLEGPRDKKNIKNPHGDLGSKGGTGVQQKLPGVVTSYELEIADIQGDNYSETAVFPVLLHSFSASQREAKKAARKRKRAVRRVTIAHSRNKGNGGDRSQGNGRDRERGRGRSMFGQILQSDGGPEGCPFFTVSAIQERTTGSAAPIFKYVGLRILEIKLAVDSSTLQLYFCDLHTDLRGESREQALASELPGTWLNQFNHKMITPGYSRTYGSMDGCTVGQLVDLIQTAKTAQECKMYFETFIIHPIKLRLSFLPTPFPRPDHDDILSAEEYRGFKIVRAIAQVDQLVVRIGAFYTVNAMESTATLGSRVIANVLRDLQNDLVTIVGRVFGSLEFIGKPAGLYRNVGEGLMGFFYEVR